MSLLVQKYGGSSIATMPMLRAVARRIARERAGGHDVAVVLSAMGGTTDELIELARRASPRPSGRELDLLLTCGERMSISLLAMALRSIGCDAIALTGAECGIVTTAVHGDARIVEVRPERLLREIGRGRVGVVAGFQGVTRGGETTTLGRGGSDTTACALAAALRAERCDVLSDVDGVYSADPRVVASARRIDEIDYDEMQELARFGARVLHSRAIEHAKRGRIAIHARAAFGVAGDRGTVVRDVVAGRGTRPPVTGVAATRDVLHVKAAREDAALVSGLDGCDVLARRSRGRSIELLIAVANLPCRRSAAERIGRSLLGRAEINGELGWVAAVGPAAARRERAAADARRALTAAGVPLVRSFTAPRSVSCLVPADAVNRAVRAIHSHFLGVEAPS